MPPVLHGVLLEQGALPPGSAETMFRIEGRLIPSQDASKRTIVFHQPRGAWALLTPWNAPLNIPVEYLSVAIATGSPFVWKPAPSTSRIAVRLMELIDEQDLPPGMANMAITDSPATAEHLVQHPAEGSVGLTGSSETGRRVAQLAWDKHLLMELGGNGPTVVLRDADLDLASEAIASSAFKNAGQICSAAGRVIADEVIAADLAERLCASAEKLVVGDPTLPTVDMGPVHMRSVADRVLGQVASARRDGARVLTGGHAVEGLPTDLYLAPTVLDAVSMTSSIVTHETFGPAVPIVAAHGDEEILEVANRGNRGLAAALFTRSLDRAFWFGERLASGTVTVNDKSSFWEVHVPFGGWAGRESGRGRIGGTATFDEFLQTKTLNLTVG